MKIISKRLLALSVALLIVSSAFLSPLTVLAADKGTAESKTVSYASPAIPANSGTTVRLSNYSVMYSEKTTLFADSITWTSRDITITDGTVTPTEKGVYELTAASGSKRKTVYLVVKDPSESDYVLYEEDFDDAETLEELGYETIQCTDASTPPVIENGKLLLSAQANGNNYIRVLLPEWLGEFGNYKIDAVATMSAYEAINRWMSVMFRVQNDNIPYYQFAQRGCTEASNGTELALRTAKDTWDVQYTSPYPHRVSDRTYRTFTVEAYGPAIRTAIDGKSVITTASGSLTSNGRIGFQVRACELSVDEIRVSLQLGEPEGTAQYLATVSDPDSNVILPPSVIAEISTEEELNALKTALQANKATLPSTAVFTLGSDLSATVGGTELSLDAILTLLDERVIPAFRVPKKSTAEALAARLKNERVIDAFVISDDAEVLKAARNAYEYCRAVLDFSDLDTLPTQVEIRSQTNACGARICLLPPSGATKDTVETLQRLLMTVWVQTEETEGGRVTSIVSGANGITASDFAAVSASYTKYFKENTIVRPSGFVGHRGVPSLAQENTIAGSMLAYELGATAIECDVYLSADGVVVVMHDTTLDRTTNATGNVSDYTYAELCEFVVDGNTAVDPEPIPTLADYFETFKGLDVEILIEIKTSNSAICQKIADLIEEYDFYDQANVIAFGISNMVKMKEVCPEVSVGYLTSSPALNETNPEVTLPLILAAVQTYDTTYNPSYMNGALGPNQMRAAAHRGVTFWPWTINDKEVLNDYFLYGTHGITTNYVQFISDCTKRVDTDSLSYHANIGDEIKIALTGTTYARETEHLKNGSLVFIEGDDIFSYKSGVLTADGVGKATLMISVPCLSPGGDIYYLCTTPFTAEVGEGLLPETAPDTESGPTDEGTAPVSTVPDTQPIESGGCGSVVSAPAAVLAASVLTVGVIVTRKRRRD